MSIIIFVFIVFIYAISNVYIAKRIFKILSFHYSKINVVLFSVIYTILAISFLLEYLPLKILKTVFNYIGSFWMGLYVYLLITFLVTDIVLLGMKLAKLDNDKISKILYHIAISIVGIVMIFGMCNAILVKNKEYSITVKNSNLNENINLILISDLHLGSPLSENRLKKTVAKINEQNPDIVCIAGDIFDNDYETIKNDEEVKNTLKSIKSKYGVYACLGNHDSGSTFDKMLKLLKDSNVKLLNDEFINIENKFILIGRLDSMPIGGYNETLERDYFGNIMGKSDTDLPIFVMDHNPANCEEYKNKVDLVMSGHTHKGQIFPANFITKNLFLIDYGFIKLGSTNIIVTSGAGTWKLPLRIGSNNEVVKINICSEK